MKKQDAEDMFVALVGTVWGLSNEPEFDLHRFNKKAKEIRDKYLPSKRMSVKKNG